MAKVGGKLRCSMLYSIGLCGDAVSQIDQEGSPDPTEGRAHNPLFYEHARDSAVGYSGWAMASGGNVFVLGMGESVRIADVA